MPLASVRLSDGTVQICARGDIDLDNAYLIREAVDDALVGPKPVGIIVDLALVTVIDSVSIGTLVACFHTASASGVRLRVSNPSTIVYRQLWVAGLVGLLGLPTPVGFAGRPVSTAR